MRASDSWTNNQVRLDNLLTLRVLATLAVIFGHAASFFGTFSWSQFPQMPYIQSQAVTVFFLVSGYTIAWVCDRDAVSGRGISNFLYDRTIRLLVPLLPILVLMAMAEYWLFETHPYSQNFNLQTFISNLFFLQNMTFGIPGFAPLLLPVSDAFGTNRPLWTISLEFWIYVAFAGSFFAFNSRSRGAGLASITVGIVGWLTLNGDILGGRGSGLTVVWLAGAMMYWTLKKVPLADGRTCLIAMPLFAIVATMLAAKQYWPIDGTYSSIYNMVIAIAFFLFIAACPKLPLKWTQTMNWFGSFAYTAYLAHYPIQYWLWHSSLVPRGHAGAIIATCASLAISFILGQAFERHYKTVRNRILSIFQAEQRHG